MSDKEIKQPKLVDDWGCEFFGVAKTAVGDIWYYETIQDDGSIKRYALRPKYVEIGKHSYDN